MNHPVGRMFDMRLLFAAALACASIASGACAGPFDGVWSITFGCDENSSPLCRERPDSFSLTLWSTGRNLCGNKVATAYGQNKIEEDDGDDPTIIGKSAGARAIVTFTDSEGGSGRARLSLRGRQLGWHIIALTQGTGGDDYLPQDAVLTRSGPKPAGLGGCP